ncbi:phosphoribosylglycinamide formyltransferase [Shimia sagamensis]|uniref:Phosphoribosylglycinamide formyltransferase n=1 Tax=Shimia sagamensis TaxID=1566352 RepID=A0ABY1NI37_9RHOB|nr:phosphoribosylglycinamide formyltransferase [Shimia sagamensis]SMP10110.1 phosphoribosylglycinamide formyltransferase-1 [Shimia sagamensis]
MKKRVAIFISGGGSNMVRLLEDMALPGHAAEPVLVLANSADAAGLAKAEAMGVKAVSVDHRPFKGDRPAFEAALQAELDQVQPDILCLAGFMRVLTEGFVAPWEGRMLNIHPSLLPKYKGLHTHARALEAGDKEHGCTVHLVTPALDDGPILGQARIAVEPGDTPDSLASRVLVQEHKLYPAVLRQFAVGNTTPVTL